jgi:hypothetical protein
MKHFKLSGWPDVPPAYRRTAYRRVMHEMSQRFMTLAQLGQASGLSTAQVNVFLGVLAEHGVLVERGEAEPESLFGMLQTLVRRRQPAQHN